jgi:hypothetical protein
MTRARQQSHIDLTRQSVEVERKRRLQDMIKHMFHTGCAEQVEYILQGMMDQTICCIHAENSVPLEEEVALETG